VGSLHVTARTPSRMIHHAGYQHVGPRSPWRATGGNPGLWRHVRKSFRVWRTHVGAILLVEPVAAMMPSFLPRMASLGHNVLR
jgi:hypothetical protein